MTLDKTFRTLARRSLILAGSTFLFAIIFTGCKKSGTSAGGATNSRAREARKNAESYAIEAARGAATAEKNAHPASARKYGLSWILHTATSNNPPAQKIPEATSTAQNRPASNPPNFSISVETSPALPRIMPTGAIVIRENVESGIPYRTEQEADEDALRLAQDRIEQRLRELDPPLAYRPSIAVIKNEYIRKNSRNSRVPTVDEKRELASHGYDSDRVYISYDIELTSDQIRQLRTRDRLVSALRMVGIVTVIALAGFLFLRLDEWSKGYLTSWLAFIVIALGAGIATAVVLV